MFFDQRYIYNVMFFLLISGYGCVVFFFMLFYDQWLWLCSAPFIGQPVFSAMLDITSVTAGITFQFYLILFDCAVTYLVQEGFFFRLLKLGLAFCSFSLIGFLLLPLFLFRLVCCGHGVLHSPIFFDIQLFCFYLLLLVWSLYIFLFFILGCGNLHFYAFLQRFHTQWFKILYSTLPRAILAVSLYGTIVVGSALVQLKIICMCSSSQGKVTYLSALLIYSIISSVLPALLMGIIRLYSMFVCLFALQYAFHLYLCSLCL